MMRGQYVMVSWKSLLKIQDIGCTSRWFFDLGLSPIVARDLGVMCRP